MSGRVGPDWTGHVVVLVPGSVEGMAGLLGSPASQYRGIAAVTTGEVGGPPNAPADRIIINPDAYALLGPLGKQVVLTHETTHVATRAHTTAATPLWLSEGYADWIGYRGTGRTPSEAAPELARAVDGGATCRTACPTDGDFGFSGDATKLAQSYEGGWMACRMIAGAVGRGAARPVLPRRGRPRAAGRFRRERAEDGARHDTGEVHGAVAGLPPGSTRLSPAGRWLPRARRAPPRPCPRGPRRIPDGVRVLRLPRVSPTAADFTAREGGARVLVVVEVVVVVVARPGADGRGGCSIA